MPQRHRDCLEFLMFHLARVAQREPENLVSVAENTPNWASQLTAFL